MKKQLLKLSVILAAIAVVTGCYSPEVDYELWNYQIKPEIQAHYKYSVMDPEEDVFDLINPVFDSDGEIFVEALEHIDDFLENGYTREEEKMSFETKKILHDESILVTATTVRVPVFNVHSESVNVELEKEFDIDQIRRDFEEMDNLVVLDDIRNNLYPMPCNVDEQDKVFVGRIRRDETVKNGLNIWVVADNIRKGAATNAVQILECLLEYKKEGR